MNAATETEILDPFAILYAAIEDGTFTPPKDPPGYPHAATARKDTTCPKCCGNGRLDAYWRIAGGVCFRCGGTGIDPRA